MTYIREQCCRPYSLARWQLRMDQSEINESYWAGQYSLQATRHLVEPDTSANDLATKLGIKNKAFDKVGHSEQELRRRLDVGERWSRLGALVSVTSSLERYIVGIASAAIDSDPLLLPGWPKRLDGLAVDKFGLKVSKPSIIGLTKGTWQSRLATYKDLFGTVPQALEAQAKDLEAMRKMRNAVAHDFAADRAPHLSSSAMLLTSIRRSQGKHRSLALGHDRFVKWLGVVHQAADAIDAHLLAEHVGDYELAALYMEWQRSPDKFEKGIGATVTGHRRDLNLRFPKAMADYVPNMGRPYLRSMETFVRQLH